MTWQRLLSVLFLFSTPIAAHACPNTHAYSVTPIFTAQGDIRTLRVTIQTTADEDGVTVFDLPDNWAGETELWRYLKDFNVTGGIFIDTAIDTAIDIGIPAEKHVKSQPGAPIQIDYSIASAIDNTASVEDEHPFKPWITPDWLYLAGEAIFALPRDREGCAIEFTWHGPQTLPFASDLEHDGGAISDFQALQQSILIAGKSLRIAQKGPIRLAQLGSYEFEDEALLDKIYAITTAQRAFWGDAPDAPYLVTNAPLAGHASVTSFTGTGKGIDGFAITMTETTQMADISWFLAHESFHSWNPVQLGGFPEEVEDFALNFQWFSEGFTEYYARKLLLNSGQFAPEEFATSWNDLLLNYATSFNAPDGSFDLPYLKGAVLAVHWDYLLRHQKPENSSLDAIMKAQRRAASSANREGAARLFESMGRSLHLPIDADLERYNVEGARLFLHENSFGPCFVVETIEQPAFHRGFDRDATLAAQMVVQGVQAQSPAYQAGLRDGMKIIGVAQGRIGDATQLYELEVQGLDGEVKRIAYYPKAEDQSLIIQHLVPKTESHTCS